MRSFLLLILAALAVFTQAYVTHTFPNNPNPTDEEKNACGHISSAMIAASARWDRLIPRRNIVIAVSYNPALDYAAMPTAGWDGARHGYIVFGPNTDLMVEWVALWGISQAMGVGSTTAWVYRCAVGVWPRSAELLRTWGEEEKVECDGKNMKPYGMDMLNQCTDTVMDRHVLMTDAEIQDMGAGTGDR